MAFNLVMVGSGQPGDLCGAIKSEISCSVDPEHFRRTMKYYCFDWPCPTCLEDHVELESWNVAEHLVSCRDAYYKNGVLLGDVYHVKNLSPPEELRCRPITSKAQLDSLRKKAISLAKSIGCVGGAIFLHPVRGNKHQRELHRSGKIELPTAYHYHILGFFPNSHTLRSDDLYRTTGWIYGRKPLKSQNTRNIKKVAAYELDHAAVNQDGGSQIVSYFGVCARNNFNVDVQVIKTAKLCPVCHAEVRDETGRLVYDFEELRIFKLRKSALVKNVLKYRLPVEVPHGESLTAYV